MTTTQVNLNLLTYSGPTEVLVKTPVILSGTFNPAHITTVSLVAEDKFPLRVSADAALGIWKVELSEGFYNAGARWLRLKGTDPSGKALSDQVINITIGTEASTVGQEIVLKVLTDTVFKSSPADSSTLDHKHKVPVKAGASFHVKQYGFLEGHLKVELVEAIAPVGQFGYFFAKHISLTKGQKAIGLQTQDVPPPVITGMAKLRVLTPTLLKSSPADSSTLAANQKVELPKDTILDLAGYACVSGHFRISLAKEMPGFGKTGFIYWEHVQVQRDGKEVIFDPDALTVVATKDTTFKKRPVDSNNLQPQEKITITAGATYGVAGYAPGDGHIKVALTENIPGFGNTGFLFTEHMQLRRGTTPIDLSPSQVELNVPYFSQRDNPRWPGSTCNVTSIAMVLYYYGVRAKRSGAQLEDELLQWCLNRYGQGSQTDNSVLVQLVQAYGFKSSFNTNRSWAQIRREIASGRPVVVGGYFTHSGHIITIIGYTSTGYIVNDPWGNALNGYWDTEGRKLLYPGSYMSKMCCPEGDGNIWAHFISR